MEALQALGHSKSSLSVFVADMTLFDRFDLPKHEKVSTRRARCVLSHLYLFSGTNSMTSQAHGTSAQRLRLVKTLSFVWIGRVGPC